jgi:hypothetical protein
MAIEKKFLIDWVWGNSKFAVPETLTIDRGEVYIDNKIIWVAPIFQSLSGLGKQTIFNFLPWLCIKMIFFYLL